MRRLLAVFFALVSVAACNDDGGDTPAARTVKGAARTMAGAGSFHYEARLDVTSGEQKQVLDIAGDFQAPDRVHFTLAVGPTKTEFVIIKDQSYQRPADGEWKQSTVAGAFTGADPRNPFRALEDARSVEPMGGQENAYRFTLGKDAAVTMMKGLGQSNEELVPDTLRGDVTLRAKEIARIHHRSGSGQSVLDVQVSYSQVGAAPPVEPPV